MLEDLAREIDVRLINVETQLENKVDKRFYPNTTPFVDLINVYIFNIDTNDYDLYYAIDDIFKSITGKYYLKVWIDEMFIEVNINKISSVTIFNTDSYIVNNWNNIKKQIERTEKIKRLL